ncbi:hypothetical protein F5X99DRAFT_114525 [Biscogniauxia marginata]|nr:hypothetical protein F5X99DRAFT_114525 [Biscogniauxia marginata]
MAHLNVPSTPQAAIFSPSVARAAASTAKDWAYVDGWLRAKYALLKRRPPPFERNPDTLRALLALAAANEAADEERDQLARVEDAALAEVRAAAEEEEAQAQAQRRKKQADTGTGGHDENADDENRPEGTGANQNQNQNQNQTVSGALLASDLLHAFDDALTRDGRAALDAMADVAVELGIAPQARISSSTTTSVTTTTTTLTPESLGRRFVELQGSAYEIDQAAHRVDMLRRYLESESTRLSSFLSELRLLNPSSSSSSFTPHDHDHDHDSASAPEAAAAATDLARQNLETQRRTRAASARLPELRQQVAALARAVGVPPLTVEDVRRDEEAYLELLSRKRDLDARVRAFAGLPPDVEAARAELERLRAELRDATERRDANFESLVERESPVKVKTSRGRP